MKMEPKIKGRKSDNQGGKRKGNRGISIKLLGVLLPVIIATIIVLVMVVYTSQSKNELKKSEALLDAKMQGVVSSVQAWKNKTVSALETQRDALEYFPMTAEEELDYIKHTEGKSTAYPAGIYIGTNDGRVIHSSFVPDSDYILSEKPWFTDGLKSEPFILGAIYFDSASKSHVVGASGVLKDHNGEVRGVAAADIYLDAISEIVKPVQLEKTGGAFLTEVSTGMVIGHKDKKILGTVLGESKDKMYSQIGKLVSSEKYGLQTVAGSKGAIYVDIKEVPDTDWVVVGYVPKAEVMVGLVSLTRTLVVIAIVAILTLIILITLLLRRLIIKPIHEIGGVARRIAKGELNEEITYRSNDELGQLAIDFNKTVVRLREYVKYINEVSSVLGDIAEGRLDFTLAHEYEGEFAKVKTAMEHISDELNGTMNSIRTASGQVTSGSHQIADGAQSLAQGAVEQSSSTEKLAQTVGEISDHLSVTVSDAQRAKEQSNETEKNIMACNEKMQNMTEAINLISDKSAEIGKIIKTIEDIAFQTNILALNAAVEAARAGAAGKGFAVVADEVRNLASKSAEAAKSTSRLIEDTINAVQNGTLIADDTAKSMMEVVEHAKEITESIDKIAYTISEQGNAVEDVREGVEQVSAVVQLNSATAEESSAASEELSGQAQELLNLVEKFRLK
ncbi:MAG: methyl-accepting chemotaxis protein [Lachnospiraceae bacterium]